MQRVNAAAVGLATSTSKAEASPVSAVKGRLTSQTPAPASAVTMNSGLAASASAV